MLKKIFESTLIMGASSILVMLMDLIRVKITAVLLGPLGVGTLSVLNQFHSLVVILLGLGLGTGITKYVASSDAENLNEYRREIFLNSFQIVILISFIGLIITCILSKYLSKKIFGDENYFAYIIMLAISFPLAVYPNIASSILQGLKRIKQLAKINCLRSFISLIIIIPIVYFFRLEGAISSAIIISAIHIGLCYYYIKKEGNKFIFKKWLKFNKNILKKLFRYGITSLIVGTAYYLSHLILKILIVNSLGLRTNGIYQPVWALTMTYLGIVLSSMSAYSYPRLCEIRNFNEINNELNGIIRIAFLFIMPAMFFLLITRKPIIIFLYSNDFVDATIYMPIQVFGDFFKVLFWALGMYLLPSKRFQSFILFNILIDFLLVSLTYFFIDIYKLHGVTASFALSYIVGFIVLFVYSKKKMEFKFWPANRLLILSSLIALILIIISEKYVTSGSYVVMNFFIIILWAFVCIKKEEALKIKDYLIYNFPIIVTKIKEI